MVLRLIILTSILSISLFANAQYSNEYKNYKSKYPKDNEVEIVHSNTLEITLKKKEINILEKYASEKIYLNSTAKYQVKESIQYSSFYNIDKVVASSFNYNGEKYKEFKVSDYTAKDELSSSTFFDDKKSINFYYQGLDIGSKTKISYNTQINNPRFLGAYFFGGYSPIESYHLKIIADKNIALNFIYKYTDTTNIEFTQTEVGNKIVYQWKQKDINSFSSSSDLINFRYRIPHIIPHIKYYTIDGDTTFILNSTQDLYGWYASLIKNTNTEPCDPAIKLLVDSLTRHTPNDLEKVKNIYYWVQKNIKYVAFEDGLGGFVPRNANDVFKKKYGDCKDNSSLLQQMLKEANLKSYLTWIGTRAIPYSYNEVYTPIADNHMILTYFDAEKPYFLDATGRFLDISLPSSFIQGKEALVAIDNYNYKIITVPVVENTTNKIIEALEVTIDSNNAIIGKGYREYMGFEKTNIFNRLEGIKTKDDITEFYKNILEKGNNNFLVDSIYENNKFEYDKKFNVEYFFNIKKYISLNGDKLYINLNLNPYDVASIKQNPPFLGPVEYTHIFTGNYQTKFTIPNNYELDFLPENIIVKNEYCTIDILYETKENIIYYTHNITTHFLRLDVKQQKELNKLVDQIQRHFKNAVVLKSKKL